MWGYICSLIIIFLKSGSEYSNATQGSKAIKCAIRIEMSSGI